MKYSLKLVYIILWMILGEKQSSSSGVSHSLAVHANSCWSPAADQRPSGQSAH